jgi:hypothetical protein
VFPQAGGGLLFSGLELLEHRISTFRTAKISQTRTMKTERRGTNVVLNIRMTK